MSRTSTSSDTAAEPRAEPPWLGRDTFTRLGRRPPRRFVAETSEERRWRRWLPRLFAPRRTGSATRVINHVGVTPLAHVTLLNLDYQIYLNQIMHTSAGAWLGHVVCIPINVGLLFYALALYAPLHAGAGSFAAFLLNGGLVLLALLASWYTAMAIRMRNGLWGATALAALASVWLVGNRAAQWVSHSHDGALAHPAVLIVAVSLLQALSHLFEKNVPPRANFEQGWKSVHEFLWGDAQRVPLGRRLVRMAWTPVGTVWGAIDEWWASTKLFPLYVLELMWLCGYKPEQRERHRASSLRAIASGDPALDWVGVGGGASVVELPDMDAT